MIPGISRNWRRTSKTIAPAARVTALIARPENRKTTAAPMQQADEDARRDDLGVEPGQQRSDRSVRTLPAPVSSASLTASVIRPEQRRRGQHRRGDRDALGDGLGGVADRVELGEDLRALSSTSPDISAMPWALSLTGPKVSMATMTPTVVEQAAAGERDQEQRER